jgi:hypothetical protein
MGDRRKCQTFAASPAEPGGLPVMLATRPSIRFTAANAFVSAKLRKIKSELLRRRERGRLLRAQFDWILARMMRPNGSLCDPDALQHTTKINTSEIAYLNCDQAEQ